MSGRANLLACDISLFLSAIPGDLNGLRRGTPVLLRWGMRPRHMAPLADFIADVLLGLRAPEEVAGDVSASVRAAASRAPRVRPTASCGDQ